MTTDTSSGRRRDNLVTVRLTDPEHSRLKTVAAAHGLSQSAWIRKALLDDPPPPPSVARVWTYNKHESDPAWWNRVGVPYLGSDEWGRRTVVIGLWFLGYVVWAFRTCWCEDCHISREYTYRMLREDHVYRLLFEDHPGGLTGEPHRRRYRPW